MSANDGSRPLDPAAAARLERAKRAIVNFLAGEAAEDGCPLGDWVETVLELDPRGLPRFAERLSVLTEPAPDAADDREQTLVYAVTEIGLWEDGALEAHPELAREIVTSPDAVSLLFALRGESRTLLVLEKGEWRAVTAGEATASKAQRPVCAIRWNLRQFARVEALDHDTTRRVHPARLELDTYIEGLGAPLKLAVDVRYEAGAQGAQSREVWELACSLEPDAGGKVLIAAGIREALPGMQTLAAGRTVVFTLGSPPREPLCVHVEWQDAGGQWQKRDMEAPVVGQSEQEGA